MMKRQACSKYSFITIIFIVIIAMIVSCKVTRPYVQPADVISNKLFRDTTNTDTTNIANISWKQIFTDTLLQSLIQEGINNNLDLKVAVARIKAAAANVKAKQACFIACS